MIDSKLKNSLIEFIECIKHVIIVVKAINIGSSK